MITQKYKNGTSEIIIESAESLLDARKNGFPDKVFSRFYVNGKSVPTYSDVVSHIITETKKGGAFKMPSREELQDRQHEVILSQKKMISDQIEKLKNSYEGINVPKEVLDQFDNIIKSLDVAGVRVAQ